MRGGWRPGLQVALLPGSAVCSGLALQGGWDEGWEGPAPGWEGLAQLQFCSPSVALGRDSTSVSSPLKWGSNSLQCSKGEAICVCSSLPHPSGDPLATAPHLALA